MVATLHNNYAANNVSFHYLDTIINFRLHTQYSTVFLDTLSTFFGQRFMTRDKIYSIYNSFCL